MVTELAGHLFGTAADSQSLQRRRDGAPDLAGGVGPGGLQGRGEQRPGPGRLERAWPLVPGKRRLRSQNLRHRPCLAQQLSKVDRLFVRHLERDLLVDPRVLGEIDGSETSAADRREDFVFADDLAAEEHPARV